MSDTQTEVIKIVADKLGAVAAEVTPETRFVDDLGADSLDYVELVMALEEAFNVAIPDEAVEEIQTIGQVVAYLEANTPK
ncbi:MAG: acyl carrier protein [Bacteroidota bacterium]